MISTTLSRVATVTFLLAGVALLFAPHAILPRLIPGYPPGGLWVGQLVGAAWLALAALNWLSQHVLLGGIYGRPVVMTNAANAFIGTTVLGRAATQPDAAGALWAGTVVLGLLAILYCWLLFRGPLERDLVRYRDE